MIPLRFGVIGVGVIGAAHAALLTQLPETRLVSIADVYTSLRARRAYKPSLSTRAATAEMEVMAGRELDPDMTRDFLTFIRSYEQGRGEGRLMASEP